MERLANNAETTLAQPMTAEALTLTVFSATKFPDSGNFRIKVDDELMLVTAVVGNVLTVTRAIEGTFITNHTSAVPVRQVLTVEGLLTLIEENGGGDLELAALRVLVSDADGAITVSAVTPTELGHLEGVTSGLQAQLNAKAATASLAVVATSGAYGDLSGRPTLGTAAAAATGDFAATSPNLTALAGLTGAADRVGYFTALGTMALAVLTSFGRTLLACVDAAAARTALGASPTITGAASSIVASNLTANRVLISDSNGKVSVTALSPQDVANLSGTTTGVQEQINGVYGALVGYEPVGALNWGSLAPQWSSCVPSTPGALTLTWFDSTDFEAGFKIEYGPNGTDWSDYYDAPPNQQTVEASGFGFSETVYFRLRGKFGPWIQPAAEGAIISGTTNPEE